MCCPDPELSLPQREETFLSGAARTSLPESCLLSTSLFPAQLKDDTVMMADRLQQIRVYQPHLQQL